MIILDTAGDTIQAEASAGSSITVNCYGIETASGTDTYKRLGTAQLTGAATQDVIYTVPASTVTICSVIVIANTSGSARTIKLWDVENGGSPGDANAILGTVDIAANTTIIWNKGNIMTMPTSVGAGGGAHAILDGSTHSDSVADAVTRGSIIYGNATPKWDELTVGGAGTVLGSDGTDISWVASGGTGFGRPLVITPQMNEPPSSNFATLDTRNNHPVLDFDATTNESAVFRGVLPVGYASGGLTVYIHYAMTSAEVNTIDWDVSFERIGDQQLDIDGDSFAAVNSVDNTTVPGTTGLVDVVSVAFTDGADMDSIAAGESFRIKITRDAASDDAAGDAELLFVVIKET